MNTKLAAEMPPAQIEFLEQLASKPDETMEVLRECKVSARKLASWLSDPKFRGAYMVRCAHYEEMQFPGFVASMRAKAMGDGKDAPKFAVIYMEMLKGRSEYMLQEAYPEGDVVPPSPVETDTGQEPQIPPGYEDLGQEEIADLLSPDSSGATS